MFFSIVRSFVSDYFLLHLLVLALHLSLKRKTLLISSFKIRKCEREEGMREI